MKKESFLGKVIVVVICLVILVYIGLQFFVLDKDMRMVYNFSRENPESLGRVSDLMPWYRLMPIERKAEDPYQVVKDALVYFNVRIPPNFDEAEIMVKYKGDTEVKLGAELAKGNYEYMDTENYEEDGWKIAKADFEIREIFLSNYLIENNKLKFAISAPGVNEENKMEITEVDVLLKNSGFTKQGLINMFRRVKGKIIK